MTRTYYLVEGESTPFATLKEIRLWLYGQDIKDRFQYDTFKILSVTSVRAPYIQCRREIHVHPITGEVWFSKVV